MTENTYVLKMNPFIENSVDVASGKVHKNKKECIIIKFNL